MKEYPHSFGLISAKVDGVDGQLNDEDRSCATIGSKVITRAVSKLKIFSKTDEVASVGLKLTKLAFRASAKSPFTFWSKKSRRTT